MLDNGVEDTVLHWQAYLTRIGPDIVEVLFIDLFAPFFKNNDPAVVKTSDVATGNTEVHLTDLNIAFLFGVNDGVLNTAFCSLKINDLAFADSPSRYAAYSNTFQASVMTSLSYNYTDLGRADFKTDKDIISSHSIVYGKPVVLAERVRRFAHGMALAFRTFSF